VALLAFHELLEFLPVALFELMAELVLGSKTKLVVMLFLEHAITEASKKNPLGVLGESLQHLVVELKPAADVLCTICAMEQHIKQLILQSSDGWGMFSCR
jgi:hypothetical protein